MSKEHKYREAFQRQKSRHPGSRYKSHPDSAFTISHPALIELGRTFHNEWFGRGFRGALPRRQQLIDIANELLNHLKAPRALFVPDDGTISDELFAYAQAKESAPADMKTFQIALSLFCAVQIIKSNHDLSDKHYVGGMVYGPLLVLEGLLLAGSATAMAKTTPIPDADELRREHETYIKDGGDPAKWTMTLAKRYHRDIRTVQRHWKRAAAT